MSPDGTGEKVGNKYVISRDQLHEVMTGHGLCISDLNEPHKLEFLAGLVHGKN